MCFEEGSGDAQQVCGEWAVLLRFGFLFYQAEDVAFRVCCEARCLCGREAARGRYSAQPRGLGGSVWLWARVSFFLRDNELLEEEHW